MIGPVQRAGTSGTGVDPARINRREAAPFDIVLRRIIICRNRRLTQAEPMGDRTSEFVRGSDAMQRALVSAGIRPTRQRLIIASIMLGKAQHLSADQVMAIANRQDQWVSKATVYNTLSLFARSGLLREVIVDPNRVVYDSNSSEHHHIYNEDDGSLIDIDLDGVKLEGLPPLPAGTEVHGVDVIVRVKARR